MQKAVGSKILDFCSFINMLLFNKVILLIKSRAITLKKLQSEKYYKIKPSKLLNQIQLPLGSNKI